MYQPRSDDESSNIVANLLVGVVLISAVLLWFYWSSLERMTADVTAKNGMLWFYASDVAPGDVLEGRVEIKAGMKVAIAGVIVNGAGAEQVTGGREPGWGDRIETKRFAPDNGSDEFDFKVAVPADASPGEVLHLDITVEYVAAERDYARFGFTNEWDAEHFRVDVPVHGRTTSVLRRAGKAVLAFASWTAVVAFVIAVSRWYGRRGRTVSAAWLLLLLPHAVLGWFWFSTLLEHALRLHGWWMVALCLVAWYLAFAVALLIVARDGVCRYAVVQTRVPTAAGDAYRAVGADVPSVDVHELDSAWRAAGFAVERKRQELHISRYQGGEARVVIPGSERFGGGEPFEIRTSSHATALALVTAATSVLGELRWTLISGGKLAQPSTEPNAAPLEMVNLRLLQSEVDIEQRLDDVDALAGLIQRATELVSAYDLEHAGALPATLDVFIVVRPEGVRVWIASPDGDVSNSELDAALATLPPIAVRKDNVAVDARMVRAGTTPASTNPCFPWSWRQAAGAHGAAVDDIVKAVWSR